MSDPDPLDPRWHRLRTWYRRDSDEWVEPEPYDPRGEPEYAPPGRPAVHPTKRPGACLRCGEQVGEDRLYCGLCRGFEDDEYP